MKIQISVLLPPPNKTAAKLEWKYIVFILRQKCNPIALDFYIYLMELNDSHCKKNITKVGG
jgi:hypothetical protein